MYQLPWQETPRPSTERQCMLCVFLLHPPVSFSQGPSLEFGWWLRAASAPGTVLVRLQTARCRPSSSWIQARTCTSRRSGKSAGGISPQIERRTWFPFTCNVQVEEPHCCLDKFVENVDWMVPRIKKKYKVITFTHVPPHTIQLQLTGKTTTRPRFHKVKCLNSYFKSKEDCCDKWESCIISVSAPHH